MDLPYKKQKCYTYMSDKEKDCFDKLVAHYSPFLSNSKSENATNIRLTLHDFDHHCNNIFVYISKVIVSDIWSDSRQLLLSRELYILNLAVLFHDISLHTVQSCDRKMHARLSAEWVAKEYKDASTAFSDSCAMTESEVDALCAVIRAHSDEEGENGKELQNANLRDYPTQGGDYIRARLLAGILRLADELDITEMRIGDRRFERQLKDASEEYLQACNLFQTTTDPEIRNNAEQEMKRLRSSVESYKHWRKLHCFEEVLRDNTAIVLKVKEKWLNQEMDLGNGDEAEELIKEVYLKVSKEFLKIQKYAFDQINQSRAIIAVDRVEVCGVEPQLKKSLERKYQDTKRQLEEETKETEEKSARQIEGTKDLEREICNLIERNHLLTAGHYIMNSKYCVCDWIDTMAVIENMDIYRSCVNSYIRHISNLGFQDTLLVGLDLQGAIMASTVGFAMGIPFTYIIPVHKKAQNSERDSRFDSANEKNVILFTDAIVTTQSIEEACDIYDIQQKSLKAVYTIFYRPIKKDSKIETVEEKYKDKIYYINDEYEAEVIDRDACKRNDFEKCLACNKQIDLDNMK